VKAKNSSVYLMENCKACGNSGSAVLPVVPNSVNVQGAINPIIQYKTRPINHAANPTRKNSIKNSVKN
jgi:hypothetical protein